MTPGPVVLRCACGDTPADEIEHGRGCCVHCGMPLRAVELPPKKETP